MKTRSRRGVTLIEVLMAIVISSIALFALVPPFIAEGSFFRKGKRQTEAQRDAQMVLRAMARVARESASYDASVPGAITFLDAPMCGGDATFELHGVDLHRHCGVFPEDLISGRSQVTSFTVTPIIANRLVRINLTVTHHLRPGDPPESETLETELFLRNG